MELHDILDLLVRYAPVGMGSQHLVVCDYVFPGYDPDNKKRTQICRILSGEMKLPRKMIKKYTTADGMKKLGENLTRLFAAYPGWGARMLVYERVTNKSSDHVLSPDEVGAAVAEVLIEAMVCAAQSKKSA